MKTMNIYDKKVIRCVQCKKFIGEIDYNATVIFPRCGDCSDPTPHVKDLNYTLKRNYDFPKKQIINTLPS
ncbi:MAG: hypothetical protein ACE5R3_02065 [Nitrosopumilaceae archaeon]